MDGSKFATDIFLSNNKFMPTQNINIEPIREILAIAQSVIILLNNLACNVIEPSHINTGIALNIQPFPKEHVNIIIIIKSNTDLVAKIE